eukprot:2591170-Lingulodinium_polyedra.AAC.1
MILQYADALLRAVLDAGNRLALPASDAAHADQRPGALGLDGRDRIRDLFAAPAVACNATCEYESASGRGNRNHLVATSKGPFGPSYLEGSLNRTPEV